MVSELSGATRLSAFLLPPALAAFCIPPLSVVHGETRDRFWLAGAIWMSERVHRLKGEWQTTRALLDRGLALSPREQGEALRTLIRHGWGQDNPAFRQMFTTRYLPGGTQEQMAWYNELERISASPDNAVRIFDAIGDIEISDLLAKVTTPTLVLHCRGDAGVPFDEGRRLAAMIPNARFVGLEGENHLILEHEPAWPRFLSEVRSFLAP